ncbi:MAG: tetratricopeptide repeat protein [Rubrobacteraceae bacterium]|nr:tetratricopeptide repeat protein [Rubrobacteraceae bacterium]MCL6437399.1 tetratricopeptide repeat protein [Rubrobacteraceae bacterium]
MELKRQATGLKIAMLGEFRVWRGEEPVGDKEWGRQKTRSLLKLLLTRPGQPFSRDEILEALWPGVSPEAAERSLRVTVSLLRRVLEPDLRRGSDSRYVLSKRPGYAFARGAGCEVDIWDFEGHREKAEAARQAGRIDEAIEEYGKSLGLVRGELLAEDPYEEWAIEARERWQDSHLSALSGLAECLALRGRYSEAIEVCNRALTLDRYGEELRRRLMLYHYCAGEQGLALRAYRDYAGLLEDELGTAPSPELARLKERIEARDVPGVDEARRYPRPRRPMRFPYSLGRTHFAGRDPEYAMLAARLGEALEGSGGAVAVEGEAGVGKTRLVEEFLGYARSRGVRVLSGRCYERELGPPLEPVMDALSGVAETEGLFPETAGPPREEPDHPWTASTHDVTRIYRTLTGKLIQKSRAEGVVLFVDDVQWADPATLGFLSHLAKRASGERLLLIVTYRREQKPELSGWLGKLAERRALGTVSLDRLSPEDLTQILARMSCRTFDELPLLARFLYQETEGNPFYAVEYLRWLIESGAVEVDPRRRISGLKREVLREGALPSGVRALIQARFGGLSEKTRNLLGAAAVIGRSFDAGLLCRVVDREETEVFDAMEPLIGSGLIVGASQETKYYFSHDKLRQALYEGTGGPRLRQLHLRVAAVLEEEGGEPAELAHHYIRAEAWRPALENLTRAARQAEEGHAWETALKDYDRALEIVERLPGSEEERFRLLSSRESLLEHLDRREERAATVEEMFELARRLGDPGNLAEVCIRRIGVLMSVPDPAGAEESGREALAIFQELKDRVGEARAHRELGYVRWVNRDYAGALEANLQALWIHRGLEYRQAESGDASNIAQVYRRMGDYDSALRWTEEAIRIDRELGDELSESFKMNTMANIYRERGDLETALSLHLKSLSMCTRLGIKNLEATQHINCGRLYLSLQAPEEALEHFRAAARLSEETGYARDGGYSLMGIGVCLEHGGDAPGAAETYRRAAGLLEKACEDSGLPEDLSGKAEALSLLGAVLHHPLDRPAEALDAYLAAAGIYRKLGDRGRLRRLLMNLAGLRWRMGDLEGSASAYEEALELAREHGEAEHVSAALASLSVVYRDLDHLRESIRSGKEALELLRSLEDPQAEAYVLTSLADSYRRLGHYSSALSCLKRSLRLRRAAGDGGGEVGTLRDLAEVYRALGDAARAREALEEALDRETRGITTIEERRG